MQQITKHASLLPILVFLVPALAFGQTNTSLQATARAERADIQLGQPTAVIVDVKGCSAKPEIQIPTSDNCTITLAGRLSQSAALAGLGGKGGRLPGGLGVPGQNLADSLSQLTDRLAKDPLLDPALKGMNDPDLKKQLEAALGNLNSAKSEGYAYVYHIHATHAGSVIVPPFTVTADGQTATTKPIELHVTPTRSQDLVQLGWSLSNAHPVVGQEARLNIDVMVRREEVMYGNKTYPHLPLKDVHLTLPPLEAGPMEPIKPLEEVLKEHAPPPGHHGYKINHLPGQVVFEKELDGRKEEIGWYRRRLEVPVRFKQAGKLKLEAAGVAGEAWVHGQTASRRPAGRWQPFVAVSNPLEIEVHDLPADRPSNFTGNIGELRVTTSASQTKMPAGTPFTLTVRLQGTSYLPRAGSVDLTANPEFARRFRALANNDRAVSDTLREVTYTLRPLNATVKEVPSVAVGYFDSPANEFKTAKSAPIPLEVTPAPDGASAADPPSSAVPTGESADELPPLEDLATAHQRGFLARNFLAAAVLVLAGAVVAGALAGGRMRRAARRWRAQQALRIAERHQHKTAGEVRRQLASSVQSVHDVRELLQRVLRTRFGMPLGEITPQDAADRLRLAGVDEGLARSCAELLEDCTAAEFAPGVNTSSLSDLAARADRLTAQLANAGGRQGVQASGVA